MENNSNSETKGSGNSPGSHKDKPNSKNEFHWKRAARTSLIWVFIFSAAIFISNLFTNEGQNRSTITYQKYREFLEDRKISDVVVIEKTVTGNLSALETIEDEAGISKEINKFEVILPFVDKEVMAEWDGFGVEYTFKEKSIDWTGYFLNILPWLLIIAFWIFLMRRMQGGGSGMKSIFNFGKSKARIWTSDKPKVTFDDIAGCVEAKEELNEVIDFLKKPNRFQKLGATIPKGVLLVGRPGTGKTLLARAVAGEAGVPFFSLSGADFVEMFVGVGASRVRDLFEQGTKNSPCIIFIDELDAVGRQRGAGLGGGHDEREQTLNQLLVEMDGFESNDGVILIAATNRPDVLDPALLRPGRFDRQIVVSLPDIKGRLKILQVHVKDIPLDDSVDLKLIARGTPRFSGADLANLLNESALIAAVRGKNSVEMADLTEAKDKVLMGKERRSLVLSEKEKENTAYHEAGHALVSLFTPGTDPVEKVTIIPRGFSLGSTWSFPEEDRYSENRTYLRNQLTILMGGRAAEILVFDEMTTGAKQDIQSSTEIARNMVCEWGMSDELGPLAYGKKNEQIFLGRELSQSRDYSDSIALTIDKEVKELVTTAYDRAMKLLEDNRAKLDLLAHALLEYETLDKDEISTLLETGEVSSALKKKFENIRNEASSEPSSDQEAPPRTQKGGPRPSSPDLAPGQA
ncbi:MAG: ATP-dependent zinc metalloprotease FtsH [Candidatus Marinimicrobia bacterium]|nr:ATP-dependent zinc metalloprotease FtsH [Candidatus Neomarinimicrobiota bacterium]